MTKTQLELLLIYVDAKIEYEFASRDVDEDGYGYTLKAEKFALKQAEAALRASVPQEEDAER